MVSLYELYAGVERCQQPAAERCKVNAFIRPLHRLPFDEAAAAQTARIRWHLERQGMLIGPYDLMLAGQALALGAIRIQRGDLEHPAHGQAQVPQARLAIEFRTQRWT